MHNFEILTSLILINVINILLVHLKTDSLDS